MPYSTPATHAAKQMQRYRTRRQDFIESRGGKCESCGSTERLEIDHIDRADKAMPAARALRRSEPTRSAELAKCQVLCYGCHKVKTVKEATVAVHGSQRRYVGGCRCDQCRSGHTIRAREYRARKAI